MVKSTQRERSKVAQSGATERKRAALPTTNSGTRRAPTTKASGKSSTNPNTPHRQPQTKSSPPSPTIAALAKTAASRSTGKTAKATSPPRTKTLKVDAAAIKQVTGKQTEKSKPPKKADNATKSAKPVTRSADKMPKTAKATTAGAVAGGKGQRIEETKITASAKSLLHPAPGNGQNGHHSLQVSSSTFKSGRVMGKTPHSPPTAMELPPDYRPTDKEPFMSARQRQYFRAKLLQLKDDIIKQNRETLHTLHEDTAQHSDLADRATSETDRALELRTRDRQRKLVNKIDAAIARIDDGSYGYCEETGEPINLRRLDARPIATLSLEAQERHERREKVYRED